MKKRILITGASGFIGAAVTKALLQAGASLTVMVRPGADAARLSSLRKDVSILQVDLLDFHRLASAVRKCRPETAIHFATYGNHASHYRRPLHAQLLEMANVNLLGLSHLLGALTRTDAGMFIHTGSAFAEYGGHTAGKMLETRPLMPRTLYGGTKAGASLVAMSWGHVAKRNVLIFRPTYVYGPGESLDRFIPTVMRNGLQDKPVSLTSLRERKDFLFIGDLTDAYLRAVRRVPKGVHVVNLGASRESTLGEVIRAAESLVGKAIRFTEGRYKALQWSGYWTVDIRLAKKLLGWAPRTPLREGLRKTFAWIKDVPRHKPPLG